MAELAKETRTERVERLKREKNAWEHLDEIRAFAKNGWSSIPPEWLGTYFRAWGVYTQGDGAGAIGGTGGEGRAVPHFMVRIRVPNGLLLAHQVRVIADAVDKYAAGVADITVRQNIQLHWVKIEDLPDLLEQLWRARLTTMGSCGDDTRNITGCPLSGVDADEICDASPLVFKLTEQLVGNAEFYNLPRKFKISVTGCRVWCSYPEINDIGLTAVVRQRHGRPDEVGFSLRVAGGLSAEPHLAERLDAFVAWNQVVPVTTAIAQIFRDSDVLRQNRERARLKYLFLHHGWTPADFLSAIEDRLGFRLDPAVEEHAPVDIYRDHVGIHAQKQSGYCYVGAAVLRGRITGAQLRTAAEVSERLGNSQLRTTNMQNLLIVNVPRERAAQVAIELETAGLHTNASPFWRGAIACTGTEFCKIAITETKGFARWLVEELEERLPGFDQQFKLNITGCPNSCGQHWIADIGLEGKKIKENGHFVDAYYFCVGGGVGRDQAIARPVGYRCRAAEVPQAIERLLNTFSELRNPGENLRQFFARHEANEIRAFLAGTLLPAVARDLASDRPPHGVEG
ncbi:MAG TPA: nitrite/sulfite reductase [Terriglobales bacterium]|nr:nitrite/sulfite reductase [Terriglobales bacterium]